MVIRKLVLLGFLLIGWLSTQGQSSSIKGNVLGEGNPIENAKIWVEGENDTVYTNAAGFFNIQPKKGGSIILVVSHPDYEKNTLKLESNLNPVEIKLTPVSIQLADVKITDQHHFQIIPPAIIHTLNPREFEATQSVSMSEGLNFVPGLRMETNCQNCGFSQLRMNGLPGAYSQILIDGRPVFSALNGIYGLDQIPVAMVDRVEVTRGSGLVQYGSGAIGGTVNIITRDPDENTWQLAVNQGWIGMNAPDHAVSGNIARVSTDYKKGITAFAAGRHRQPYDHNGDEFSEITKIRSGSGGFRAFYKPTPYNRLVAEGHFIREFRRGGNLLELAPHEADIAEQLKSMVGGGGLSFEHFSKSLLDRVSVYASALGTRMDNYYGAGKDPDGYGLTRDFTWVMGGQYVRNLPEFPLGKAIFTSGFELKSDHMRDEKPGYGLFVDQQLYLLGIYTQQDWQIHPLLKIIPGLRMDYNTISAQMLANPRMHMQYTPVQGLQFRGSYSKGFRAPQVFSEDVHAELVAGEIQAIRLAQDLVAERSNAFTLAANWEKNLGKCFLSIAVDGFFTQIQNSFVLEELENSALFILEKRNGPDATVQGLNFEVNASIASQLTIQASYTIQKSYYDAPIVWSADAVSEDITDRMLRTPNQYGNGVVSWQTSKGWSFSTSGVFTGSMLVPHYAGNIPQDRLEVSPVFWEWNAKITRDFAFKEHYRLSVFGGMQNMLNSYQRDFDTGPLRDATYVYGAGRPRTVFAGIKIGKE